MNVNFKQYCDFAALLTAQTSQLCTRYCIKYTTSIKSELTTKNFSRAGIDGSANQKTSNVMDHASSKQHKVVMAIHCPEQAKNAHQLQQHCVFPSHPSLDLVMRERLKKKFDISYLLAKENSPFTKYPSIHKLLE